MAAAGAVALALGALLLAVERFARIGEPLQPGRGAGSVRDADFMSDPMAPKCAFTGAKSGDGATQRRFLLVERALRVDQPDRRS